MRLGCWVGGEIPDWPALAPDREDGKGLGLGHTQVLHEVFDVEARPHVPVQDPLRVQVQGSGARSAACRHEARCEGWVHAHRGLVQWCLMSLGAAFALGLFPGGDERSVL